MIVKNSIDIEANNKNEAELIFRRATNYFGSKGLKISIIRRATKSFVGLYRIFMNNNITIYKR